MTAHLYDGVFRMEFAIDVFIGLLDALDRLHDIQGMQQVDIHFGGIADQPQHGGIGALAEIDLQAQPLDPRNEIVELFFVAVFLYDDNHDTLLSIKKRTAVSAVP